MNVDSNDIEGIAFRDYLQSFNTYCDEFGDFLDAVNDQNCWTKISANGLQYDVQHEMLGRPIGFDSRMGDGGPIYPDDDNTNPLTPQPLALRIIYNTCNCPVSTFTGDQPPTDMEIRVVNSPSSTQTLEYQRNYIEYVYGQDCGSYSVTLESQDGNIDVS